ncbi:MAG: hypothetical protein HYR55_03380 [Acidobacteria bacterium]|nr:hypothetical protein [Acidobacteriota bacterium]MBI3655120.1 hypothetical protein [Acidobacteriota bacterium]
MIESSEREIVIEHALENENNLDIALDIAFAYTELRRRIIVAFLEKLELFVRQQLDESQWNLHSKLRANPFEHYAGFFVTKKAWREQYRVELSSEKYGATYLIIGIAKQAETLRSIESLKQTLDTQIRQGRASTWWDWYHQLENPYGDWDNKEALVKMYDGTAVEDLGAYFLRIVTVAAPEIDKHVSAMPA